MYFSHICHFRPMTQPNPLKTQIFDPFPTQPNPTRGSTQPMDNSDGHCVLCLYRAVNLALPLYYRLAQKTEVKVVADFCMEFLGAMRNTSHRYISVNHYFT